MKIGNDIYYVGVNDHQVDLFEGQYVVPNGMSYNSYVIMDEKIAVMDTVDANFKDEQMCIRDRLEMVDVLYYTADNTVMTDMARLQRHPPV